MEKEHTIMGCVELPVFRTQVLHRTPKQKKVKDQDASLRATKAACVRSHAVCIITGVEARC